MRFTIPEFDNLTFQEIFDRTVTHLRAQNCKSMNDSLALCTYRGQNGAKCAAGIWLTDEAAEIVEGQGWFGVYHYAKDYNTEDVPSIKASALLVSELQNVHDKWDICDWEEGLQATAQMFNLNYTAQ